jgi:cell division protein FtsB
MNLVGKLLVLLIFVMSLVFMGFAVSLYSTHKNWEQEVNREPKPGVKPGLKFLLADAKSRGEKLQAEKDALVEKINRLEAERRQVLAKLETERNQLEGEKKSLADAESDLRKQLGEQTQLAESAMKGLAERQEQVNSLRTDITTAQAERDENFKKMVEAQDAAAKEAIQLERLEGVRVALAEQLAKAKIHLDRLGVKMESPVDGIPPAVDGIVLASRDGLVEISLGADMGIARGNTLDVSRGSKYLGRIEVIQTQPDRAVARVIPEYQKGKIQKEDRVNTRLN